MSAGVLAVRNAADDAYATMRAATPASADDVATKDYVDTNASAVGHTHVEADIADLGSYSTVGHTHVEADIADLGNYSVVGHTHVEADIADLQPYLLNITGELLSDLSDVTISAVGANEVLGYSGGWINRTLAEAGIAAASHTHVEADITDLGSYSAVGHTHVEADIVDLGNYSVVGHGHVEADISDLQSYLLNITAEPLGDLSDVTITSIASGELLKWNGSAWINNTLAEAGIAAASHTHVEADITDLGNYSVAGHTHVEADIADLGNYQTQDAFLDDIAALVDPGADRLLFWDDTAGIVTWLTAGSGLTITGTTITASASAPALDDLTDVTITTVGTDEVLGYSGGWINRTLAEAGIAAASHTHVEADITDLQAYLLGITAEPLSDLNDVTITSIASGELLKWNGAAWINNTLAEAGIAAASHTHVEADITDLGNYSVVGHTHVEADIADLGNYQTQDAFLDDIAALVDPGADRLLFWDDTAGIVTWLTAGSGLTITGTTITASASAPALNDITDVTITAVGSDEVLGYSGGWINRTLAEAGIAAASHTHVEADITDLGNYTVVGHTHVEADIADLGNYQTQDAFLDDIAALVDPGADRLLFWDDTAGIVTWLTAGSGLTITGTTITASASAPALNDITDVTITSVGTDEILGYSGGWINRTLAEAGIAAASHTHVEADITDLQSYLLNITGESLGDLGDVTITTIAAGELLKWNGAAWINNTLAEAGVAAASHTHVEADITDLGNYSVVGHTHVEADIADLGNYQTQDAFLDDIAALVDPGADRLLFWDDTAGIVTWLTAGSGLTITGTTITASASAPALDDLTDVTITTVGADEVLGYSGGWINRTLAEAGIAAASHTHVEADITDLQSYLLNITGESLGDLSDVTITSIASGELLKWNGAAWINNTLAEAGIAAASHTHVEADITDLGNYSAVGHTHVEADIVDLGNYQTQDAFLDDIAALVDPGADRLLFWDDTAGIVTWLTAGSGLTITGTTITASASAPALDDLTDVTITTVGANEVLGYSGGWINRTLAEAGIAAASHTHVEADITDLQAYLLNITGEPLGDLSDVTITSIASGELLKWNGAAWINNTLAEAGIAAASHTHVEADITDLGNYSVVGHTHVEADIVDLQSYLLNITGESLGDLSDVTITSIASGELLKWDGAAWINNTLAEAGIAAASHTHVEADITDLQSYLLGITAEPLSDLNDVTITSIASGELLQWNGSAWINQTLAELALATYAGSETLTNKDISSPTNTYRTASGTTDGIVELATAAETTTGTDATRAVTPDGLAGSEYGIRVVGILVEGGATDLVTGDSLNGNFFVVPDELAGWNLVSVSAGVFAAGTTGNTDIQINNDTQAADMLSTVMRIETGERTTQTSAQPGTIDTANDDVAAGDILTIDVDAVQTGTAPKGLFVNLGFQKP